MAIHIRRRELLVTLGGAAACPLTVRAQQAARMPRIAVLLAEQNREHMQAQLAGLRHGLERLGWSDGRNIRMEYRFAESKPEQFQPLAKVPA
jgi:putative tryptophan/tyrosine transport system substrate-binding protein